MNRYFRLLFALLTVLVVGPTIGLAQEQPSGPGPRPVEEPGARAGKYRQTWAVIVGIDDYAEAGTSLPPLMFAVNDASEFRDLVREEFGYADDHVLFLADQGANRRSVRQALEKWLPERKLEPDDAVLVFFSGHGLIDKKSNQGYLALSDSSPDALEGSCIPVAWVRDRLAALPCRHKAVILDCCYSGSLFESEGGTPRVKGPATKAGPGYRTATQPGESRGAGGTGVPPVYRAITSKMSVPPTDNLAYYLHQPTFLGLSAGRFTPVADGLGKDRHSVFTSALLRVMRERADSPRPDQVFTFRQLASLVETRVANALGSQQIPNWGRLGPGDGDFLFFPTRRRETPQMAKLRTQADALAKEARLALEKGNLRQAIVLFAKSNAVGPNLPAQLSAQRLLAEGPRLRAVVPLSGVPLPLRLSRDARRAVVGLSTGEVAVVTFPDDVELVKMGEGPVSLDWSPDEQWIAASIGRKPQLRLLKTDGLKSRGEDLTLSAPAFIVQFSPDSRQLLVSTVDGAVSLWDVATGKRLAELPTKDAKKSYPRFVAYARDGRRILCTGTDMGQIDAYDAGLSKTLGGIRRQYVPFTALPQNSDGIRVVVGAGRTAAQFDLGTGKTGAVQDQIGQVVRIHHAPDDSSAWLSLSDGVVKQCKWADLSVLGEPIRHCGSVNGLDFNPAMTRMACVAEAGREGALYCWDLETTSGTRVPPVDEQITGKLPVPPPVRRIDGGPDCIDAALMQGGRLVAVRHADGSVLVHEVGSPDAGFRSGPGQGKPEELWWQVSRDSRCLVAPLGPVELVVADGAKDGEHASVKLDEPHRHFRVSPDGRYLVVLGASGRIRVWDAQRHDWIAAGARGTKETLGQRSDFTFYDVSGDRLYTGSQKGLVESWSLATGEAAGQAWQLAAPVNSINFDPSGQRAIILAGGAELTLLDVQRGKILPGGRLAGEPLAAVFTPGGRFVRVMCSGWAQKFYDAATLAPAPFQERLDANKEHSVVFPEIVFGAGDRRVLVRQDRTLEVWNAQTRRVLGRPIQLDPRWRGFDISPDGATVLVTSQESSLRLYDADTGEPRGPEVWLANSVQEHAFWADGRVLTVFCQGEMKNVRFFDTQRGEELDLTLTHDTAPHLGVSLNMSASADGARVLVWHKAIRSGGRWSGTYSVWDTSILTAAVDPAGLLARAEHQTGLSVSDSGAVEPIAPSYWQSLDKELQADSVKPERP